MRSMFGVLLLAATVTGCQSEEDFRQRWRETAVGACVQQARAGGLPQGMDTTRLCNCSIDRLMEGKSAADLRSYRPRPEDSEAAQRCAAEAIVPPQQQRG
ncbi:hypothetical protein [Sphingosinicella sp. YJ22]|uniref:hypothetical protein n=1 Tax=Sphingosinicella sp. YJ22 TaxID=1104780 RepID=UPI001409F0F1|nr:hypothetical protein [Sphingosinicella sp. YJ22]